MAKKDNTEDKRVVLPEGRVINCSLFEKDAYTDPKSGKSSKPQYKIETVYGPAEVTGEGTCEDAMLDAAAAEWGQKVVDDWADEKIDIIFPFINGDKQAAKREAEGKSGDAYKGKMILRAHTTFNNMGVDGPGGAAVYGPDTAKVEAVNQDIVYPGCYGILAVTFGAYKNNDGDFAITAYLVAFQKTKDGERLVTPQDHSTLFKPVGRTATAGAAEGGGRRARRG